MKIIRSLFYQVLFAIVAGVLLGHFYPSAGVAMKPFGDAFVKVIKMIIAPVIFCTVVLGIAGTDDLKKVGKTGGLALLYFEVVSSVSLLLGLLIVNVVQPGVGMNIDVARLDTKSIAAYAAPGKLQTTQEFLMNIIPTAFFDAFARGEILQVLFVSVLFGIALHHVTSRRKQIIDGIQGISDVLFAIVKIITYAAPIGAFGAMAFTVGAYGLKSLVPLAKLMGTFYLTCVVFVVVILGSIAAAHGFSIFRFLRYIREEILIVLGTSSSEAALPPLMSKLESLGAGAATVGLVVPTGYSFNLDGTSIYLTMAAVFLAQATNIHMTLGQQLTLLAVLMITSKGAAGVTGSGFIVLAATLSAVGTIPVASLALIFGIDRFMSQARALTNIVGNGVATVVVARWTGDLDRAQLQSGLK